MIDEFNFVKRSRLRKKIKTDKIKFNIILQRFVNIECFTKPKIIELTDT